METQSPWEIKLHRRFVYGPNYIDELVAQITPATGSGSTAIPSHHRYMLQDVNYNVVGIARECDGSLIRQFRYEPYGTLTASEDGGGVAVDYDPANPSNPIDPTNPINAANQSLLETWHTFQGLRYEPGTGLLDARTRWLNPPLARFNQRDPNEQALVLASVMAMNGQTRDFSARFVADGQYIDGPHLYHFARCNPGTYTDPSGMYSQFDWFGEADELESDLTGQKLYTLGAINEGARWASLGLQTALDIGGSLLGVDVFRSVALLVSGQGGFWESMDIFLAVAPFGPVLKAADKIHDAAKYARRAKGALIAVDKARDLGKLARRVDRKSEGFRNAVQEAKKQYPKLAGKKHSHHIVPKYLGGPPDGPTVEVNATYHQWITNEFRSLRAYGRQDDPLSPGELEDIIKKVYNKYPIPK